MEMCMLWLIQCKNEGKNNNNNNISNREREREKKKNRKYAPGMHGERKYVAIKANRIK